MNEFKAPFLQIENITKSFPGTRAVDGVSITGYRGYVHGLVGENGAGKSTLIRVIAGVHRPDFGSIKIDGTLQGFRNYSDARKSGVGVVYQNLSLLPDISVTENVLMGIWPRKRSGLIDWPAAYEMARCGFERVGLDVDPRELVSSLPMASRQLVEIAKVLVQDPSIVIFDEPTAPLSKREVDRLFSIIDSLRAEQKLVFFVSHRLDEVLRICDIITVMKDARQVVTASADTFSEETLIAAMVGREITEIFPVKPGIADSKSVAFSVSGSLDSERTKHVEFEVNRGEILGIGGLQGQGQLELLQALFGLRPDADLRVKIDGVNYDIRNPTDAMKVGIALIPENRIQEGIFSGLSIAYNVTAATLTERARLGFVDRAKENADIAAIVNRLSVRMSSNEQPIDSLSGGNMQKIVVGKWLLFRPRVIIALEPTQGVDVGTKQQMYVLFRELAHQGIVVVFYSSDMLELIGLCDHVLVMNRRVVTACLYGDDLTEEKIMTAAVARKPVGRVQDND